MGKTLLAIPSLIKEKFMQLNEHAAKILGKGTNSAFNLIDIKQGNHGQASSKTSEYLKDIQSFFENLANKVKNLEEDNQRLRNDNVNLRNQLDKRKETSPEASSCNAKISQEEVMLVEKVFKETKERNAKANNVVISPLERNQHLLYLNFVTRKRNYFCSWRGLYKPKLTKNEMAIEKELRRRRNSENEKLPFGEGRLKYGKQSDGTENYWGIRFGKLSCINRVTKKSITR
ncbi:hypothetical protein BpHYR1_015564 [Brachionus plicatilis]|uniref:Uncharacterized protein n=1 Tax=Brachionus plicatilis TaxID=10195 RepID=A0A3M7S5A9_BRAPC|nr:hypothetical protein BpHYR1_015564 [Brachionus plicatilis]